MVKHKIVLDPAKYQGRQDPLLHFRESEVVAEGEGWVALVESCGEIRAYKNGDRVYADDLADEYVDDEALDKAIESGELEVANNNWYELQFFAETEDGTTYLDITPDLVAFSLDEALEQFKRLISDKEWLERFADEVERLYHELYETDASETTLLELDTLVDNIRKEIK